MAAYLVGMEKKHFGICSWPSRNANALRTPETWGHLKLEADVWNWAALWMIFTLLWSLSTSYYFPGPMTSYCVSAEERVEILNSTHLSQDLDHPLINALNWVFLGLSAPPTHTSTSTDDSISFNKLPHVICFKKCVQLSIQSVSFQEFLSLFNRGWGKVGLHLYPLWNTIINKNIKTQE